jgi:glycosyltransferase involved in cell wall biosynthesis
MQTDMLTFSIVIPTYNRPERLKKCLQAIAKLDYPADRFEVIVVDDGSPTPIESIAAPFQQSLNLTVIRQPNSGPAKARNTGASKAKGRYLAFTDDDCAPLPDWLTQLETKFAAVPDCLIGGQTLNALPQNLYSTASQILIDYLYEYFNMDSGRSSFFASNNFAMPTHRFQELGGFDTSFPLAAGEDREFCDRWLHHDHAMLYVPSVRIQHFHHLTLQSFWRQHFNYGRGAFCFHQVRSQRNQDGIKIESLTFYTKLLLYPFRRDTSQSAILLSALLLLSQVANILGFFKERSHQPDKQLNWA